MIAHLTGTLHTVELEWIILDVHGVGYEIHVPIGTAGRLKADKNGQVSVWIHTSVREDAINLYGFSRRDHRRLFQRLTNVNGIGPRLGLATLSELSPSQVVRAVHQEDINTFTRVSGIGKKTAQRLILELKNKLDDFSIEAPDFAAAAGDQNDDLRSALLNLGFQSTIINSVVDELNEDFEDEPIEELLRRALKMLS